MRFFLMAVSAVAMVCLSSFGCATAAHAFPVPPSPPVLAPVGSRMLNVQFLGNSYENSQMFVCLRGATPAFQMQCIDYVVYETAHRGQKP